MPRPPTAVPPPPWPPRWHHATADLPRQPALRERHLLAATDSLHALLAQPRCTLGVFVPAGLHPARAERRQLDQIARAGADLFEIGLAHHDAGLDGPVIQAAYRRALSRGNVLARALRAVEHAAGLRPTVVMTYWDPVHRHGPEHLARLLADAGAAGAMVVDLPDDQAERWQAAAKDANLSTPRLVPRHLADTGLATVAAGASGWLYAPASTGPTGYRGPLDVPALADFTTRLRAASPLPVVSGVGISTPALAERVAPLVDAVVIGTPVVRALMASPEQPCVPCPPNGTHPHWPRVSLTPRTSPASLCGCFSPAAARRRGPPLRTCCFFTVSRRSPRPPRTPVPN
ncbi:tryptophan synthase subunit alpha [Streptomyces sp. WAC02707]|nr:tryptophan synthase subunit alpha [Streptomyces sp. WAC02707]